MAQNSKTYLHLDEAREHSIYGEIDEAPEYGHLIDDVSQLCSRCKKPVYVCLSTPCICSHCKRPKEDHAKDGKCLFDVTSYKG